MAQTTGAMSARKYVAEYSFDATAWVDISGYSAAVTPSASTRMVDNEYTADGDVAILTSGKREPFDITLRVVFTEGASDPWDELWAKHVAGDFIALRWAPKGNTAGNMRFASPLSPIKSMTPPVLEAGSAKPLVFELVLTVIQITQGLVP